MSNKNNIVVTGGTGRFAQCLRSIKSKYRFIYPKKSQLNITNPNSIKKYLKKTRPRSVLHLAGLSRPMSKHENNIVESINLNIIGTSNLFESIRILKIDPIIHLCSTSEVYGQIGPEDVPIKEECSLRPSSPYAVSKTTQDHLGYTYWRCYNMPIIRTRMFAYFNPRRTDLFATSFAMQVALIEAGKKKELLHGNLESVRTMIDVRDAMRSYWYASIYGKPGEVYNIGGSKSIKVGEFLNVLKKLSKKEIPCRLDSNLLRPADVTLQIPDINKFCKATGWKPKYKFERVWRDLQCHIV